MQINPARISERNKKIPCLRTLFLCAYIALTAVILTACETNNLKTRNDLGENSTNKPERNYSLEVATTETDKASLEMRRGNFDKTEDHLALAINAWPIYLKAWRELENLYKITNEQESHRFVSQFSTRLEIDSYLPPRTAAQKWKNVNLQKSNWKSPRSATENMVPKIVTFLEYLDNKNAEKQQKPTFLSQVGVVPAAVLSGGALLIYLITKLALD